MLERLKKVCLEVVGNERETHITKEGITGYYVDDSFYNVKYKGLESEHCNMSNTEYNYSFLEPWIADMEHKLAEKVEMRVETLTINGKKYQLVEETGCPF